MSVRYTKLPCGLKIRIRNDYYLDLKGDWGASNENGLVNAIKPDSAILVIDGSFENLEAISKFFAKEAEKARTEEGS